MKNIKLVKQEKYKDTTKFERISEGIYKALYDYEVENAIRPVAIGRNNYLFARSHEAAQRAAMIYSLFTTGRLHNINPYEWLKDVLERMHLYTTNNIAELLPQNWKKQDAEVG